MRVSVSGEFTVVHFTAACFVTRPFCGSEAGVDSVLRQTLLRFI